MKKEAITAGVILITAATALAKWDWFAALDEDGDGKITKAEWIDWHRAEEKLKKPGFSEEKASGWFTVRDLNGDGVITREEFDATQKKQNGNTVGLARPIFSIPECA